MWSASRAIRTRREALGMSLADAAAKLGVSKSFMSLVETGKRQLSDEQARCLADIIRFPGDLLLLGSGRLPTDVRDAIETDAAAVTAAVRARSEHDAIVCPDEPAVIPSPKRGARRTETIAEPAIPERIAVAKTSTPYRAHSYHTKVPPDAITPFIRAFTRPNDLVLDPFCGSGMTGVAALMEGRNALLSDLSPAAVHIARNYTTPCDPRDFEAALQRVAGSVKQTMDWLYRPLDGSDRVVEYTTWSDIYRCPTCTREIVFWDMIVAGALTEADVVACVGCGFRGRKSELKWTGEVPVESHTSSGNHRIDSHPPTTGELALIEESAKAPIPYWMPSVQFGSDREMWRASHTAMGITEVAQFFSRRNLHALAALRHAIVCHSEGRTRDGLLFAFTACANRASRRYQWNAKRPTNVMTGTLYISSLRYEWNVWSLFGRKAADVLRYYRSFPKTNATAQVFRRSATDLSCLPSGSVDMVFMDPPFGSNIFYADSSLLWEAWLGTLTDEAAEIVVNRHRQRARGGKSIDDYRDLMGQAFAEAGRVLRKGGSAVLAFSNSDDQVWTAVQQAVGLGGFGVERVHLLDKGQPSIKGVKGALGKENVTRFDLLLCLKQRSAYRAQLPVLLPASSALIDKLLRDLLEQRPATTDEIYSEILRRLLSAGHSVAGVTMPTIATRCAAVASREASGKWSLTNTTERSDTRDFIAGYVSSATPPVGNLDPAPERTIGAIPITGGRNGRLYLAHSYHTKVPPEAIRPFLEHFTEPGDVVLDPFCGSGMTGVAASLSGRRAILNDLSPAAVHLSWNHTRTCDPNTLRDAFDFVETRIKDRFQRLYRTKHRDGTDGLIHWTMWSTSHRCPSCKGEFLLWDAIDRATGRLGRSIKCPRCRTEVRRKELEALGSVPAWVSYQTADGKRAEKPADAEDIATAKSYRVDDIDIWYPQTLLGPDREMFVRCALHLHGVKSVADLYTPRNLLALALLWDEIRRLPQSREKRALAFAFTNTAWHGTKMRRFNARGGQRPLTGTLYIPQLSSEVNVLEVMRNKVAQLQRYYQEFSCASSEPPCILLGSATNLSAVADASVDYVFTDPPFGSNIFYADCNLIWEAWLGRITDPTEEAVVNRSLPIERGGKSLAVYAELISGAMTEIARVLKPRGWATIVFHNTDAAIWKAIRDAAVRAGFAFHEARSLDRKQRSHKGYKGREGTEDVAHFDVVLNLQKTAGIAAQPTSVETLDLETLVEAVASDESVARRGLQGIHAEVMRRLASIGSTRFVHYSDVRRAWERLLGRSPAERRRA
jgi:DNA modification methylase/transcriptional regulator with XRE-family HTH domain/DNA-directed RNA polymerase subunit RPC12/RpoP